MKRNTWQREAVVTGLSEHDGFISAQALFAKLRDEGSTISLATVYRALTDLVGEEQADSLLSPEGENLYRACSSGEHHHHLICRSCGATAEIDAEPVEAWAKQVAATHGFTQAQHVVDVFGLCAACSLT
ncbi:MAG: Zinc uptake regulation protein [Actinomycetota bacterium]